MSSALLKPRLKCHLFYDTSLMPLETLNPDTETVTQFPLRASPAQHFVQISIIGPSKASVRWFITMNSTETGTVLLVSFVK